MYAMTMVVMREINWKKVNFPFFTIGGMTEGGMERTAGKQEVITKN
jgi:hypothetical protein